MLAAAIGYRGKPAIRMALATPAPVFVFA